MKKPKTILCLLVLALALAGCGKEKPQAPGSPTETPKTELDNRNLEKNPASSEPELPGALLVMVDNYYAARPQSGLDKADTVYEMMAEGGITRFLAVFYRRHAEKIGPVRSARYYFVQLAKGYDAPLAHAGGSQDSLNMIASLGVKDLDEIYNAGGCFWRDANRKMPHNLYTSTSRLLEGARARGYDLKPPPALPAANYWVGSPQLKLAVDYTTGDYKYRVFWEFNGSVYERKINDQPHVTENNAPLTADNVIVITAKTKNIVKDKTVLSEIKITGGGEARYFIDGKMMKGSWVKKSAGAPVDYLDETGAPMKFKSGSVWVQVIPGWNNLDLNQQHSPGERR
ncbi:MAG: DUF3048 domain-containing protein [Peptococcaceae bacterium]|jgi:hypothetical protein|nr:DUF3048 domain-containing protein [Peptococcaceae bacterium]MDH7525207.1 DUF3048 domain-containing protein [Peptococcaceae bacterium]